MTQDSNEGMLNTTIKVAHITVRFLGERAESWAKAFHHLTQRKSVAHLWYHYCGSQALEYISPIIPMNIDYFGVGNTSVAHTLGLQLRYKELLDFSPEEKALPLTYVSLAPGELISGGFKS
jgi:hypothetical protein